MPDTERSSSPMAACSNANSSPAFTLSSANFWPEQNCLLSIPSILIVMSQTRTLRRTLFAALLVILSASATGMPAQSSAAATSADAPQASLPVVVLDKKGNIYQSLAKENLVLQIDGHAQTIRSFTPNTDLPLTVGLLVDASQSQRDALDEERTASSAFLTNILNGPADRDKGFVVQFARQTDLLQDVTSSQPKLQASLKQLAIQANSGKPDATDDSSSRSDGNNGSDSNSPRPRRVTTTLYDALFLSSDELMSKQTGRKFLIILSDGIDSGSKESLASSIEAAQRADTVVYTLYVKGREISEGARDRERQGGGFPGGRGGGGGGYPGGGGGYPGAGGGQGRQPESLPNRPDGKKILQRMADETGGRLFEVSKKQSVADIYKQITEELRAQYRLTYTPDSAKISDGYHKVDLSLTKSSPKDLFLQYRDGFYTGK